MSTQVETIDLLLVRAAAQIWALDPFCVEEMGKGEVAGETGIIELADFFGLPLPPPSSPIYVKLTSPQGDDSPTAVAVERILGIEEVDREQIFPLPSMIKANLAYPAISGLVIHGDLAAPILDARILRKRALADLNTERENSP